MTPPSKKEPVFTILASPNKTEPVFTIYRFCQCLKQDLCGSKWTRANILLCKYVHRQSIRREKLPINNLTHKAGHHVLMSNRAGQASEVKKSRKTKNPDFIFEGDELIPEPIDLRKDNSSNSEQEDDKSYESDFIDDTDVGYTQRDIDFSLQNRNKPLYIKVNLPSKISDDLERITASMSSRGRGKRQPLLLKPCLHLRSVKPPRRLTSDTYPRNKPSKNRKTIQTLHRPARYQKAMSENHPKNRAYNARYRWTRLQATQRKRARKTTKKR